MKKIFLLFSVLLILVVLVGADLRRQKEAAQSANAQKRCYGYTIIEFGKGIDCYGDTVKLEKVTGGGQAIATAD